MLYSINNMSVIICDEEYDIETTTSLQLSNKNLIEWLSYID